MNFLSKLKKEFGFPTKRYYKIKVSRDFLNSCLNNAAAHDYEMGGHEATNYIRQVFRANGIHTKYHPMFGVKITKINAKYEEH